MCFTATASARRVQLQRENTDPAKFRAIVNVCENNPQKITVIVSNPPSEKFTIEVSPRGGGKIRQTVTMQTREIITRSASLKRKNKTIMS